MKVSVILPIYNAEQHLEQCLESILQQTLCEFELLCIDDGSSDKSYQILQSYAEKDTRIKLYQQKNMGASAARNTGLQQCIGEYVAFLDSDDWVEPDYLEWLYTTAIEKKVKIAICGHDVIVGKQSITERIEKTGYLSQAEALQYALSHHGYQGYLWNKLFHRSLFSNNTICFDTEIHVLEDLLFTCQCIMQISEIYYDPVVKYHYNKQAGSTSKFTEKSVSMFQASCKLMELFQNEKHELLLIMAKSWHCQSAGAAYMYYEKQCQKQKAMFYKKEQKRYLKEYLQCNQSNIKMIVRGLLITYMPKLAVLLKSIKKK